MKTLALATVAALALAPSAFAFTPVPQLLPPTAEAEIRVIVPGADLSNVTDAQRAALASALHSSENGEIGPQIRAILN